LRIGRDRHRNPHLIEFLFLAIESEVRKSRKRKSREAEIPDPEECVVMRDESVDMIMPIPVSDGSEDLSKIDNEEKETIESKEDDVKFLMDVKHIEQERDIMMEKLSKAIQLMKEVPPSRNITSLPLSSDCYDNSSHR
jgi:hypothetical protein